MKQSTETKTPWTEHLKKLQLQPDLTEQQQYDKLRYLGFETGYLTCMADIVVPLRESHKALVTVARDMASLLQATIVKYCENGTILSDAEWNRVTETYRIIAQAEAVPEGGTDATA